MSTLSLALRDSATMLRRDFLHTRRYPVMTIGTIMTPIFMLLMFVYVFGGQIGAVGSGGGEYIDYLVPGILVMTVGSGCAATAVDVCTDMHDGIIPRFRAMSFYRASVLVGQVVGSVIRTMLSVVLVAATGIAMGFHSGAGVTSWCAAGGLLAMLVVSLTWIAVAFGLLAKTPAGANSSTLTIQFILPFLSSAFVDPRTMPSGLRRFAENQPFTQVIDTLRALLLGGPVGNHAAISAAWCVGLTAIGYVWSKSLFNREPGK